MEFTARQIADVLHGVIEGDETVKVSNFAKIEEGKPGMLSFLANPKYENFLYTTQSSIVLINNDFKPIAPTQATLIRVENAYASIAKLLQIVEQTTPKKNGISPLASIDTTATLGESLYIGQFAVLSAGVSVGSGTAIYSGVYLGDGVQVGKNVIIYPNVVVYHGCEIGDNCILHSGTIIGADGFGFAKSGDTYNKIPQLGNVVIENNVEIGANTTIDRATMGSTRIKQGVKLDNLIQLAHNVEVGENTVIAAQTGISGSVKIGNNCVFAGQVGSAGHITIGDGVTVGAQSGIPHNVPPGETLFGSPAISARQSMRLIGYYKRLPEAFQTINELKKELEALKTKLNSSTEA